MTTYNIILEAAFLGYYLTPRQAEEMPFNLAGEDLRKMTNEEWERYCRTFAEENRRKIREAHANKNSTAPFN